MKTFSAIVESFLNCFQFLSKSKKAVFRFLQWMTRNCRNVFVSLEAIALRCVCSIASVKRAISHFATMDWLTKTRRPYQSNIYVLHQELVNINVDDPATFMNNYQPPKTANDPKSDPKSDPKNELVLDTVEQIKRKDCTASIPYETLYSDPLRGVQGLDEFEKNQLYYQYAEVFIEQAVLDLRWYINKKGNCIRNLYGFLKEGCERAVKKFYNTK